MTRVDKINLSADESRMVADSQLGVPLEVYRMKRGVIHFFSWFSILLFLIGIVSLLLLIDGSLHAWHEKLIGLEVPAANYFQFFFLQYIHFGAPLPAFLTCLSAFIAGWMIWNITVPQVRSECMIICEEGLLHLKWRRRGKQVQAIGWAEIVSIVYYAWILPECVITYQKESMLEKLSFDTFLEDLAGMVEQMRQKTGKMNDT